MKVCSKCKETKFFDMFTRNKAKKDGYAIQCKDCYKAHYEANKEKVLERRKAYCEANKDKIKAYKEANKDKIAEQNKAYYEANKEKIAEQNKAYNAANKEKITEFRKAYYEANKEKVLKSRKAYRAANKEKIAEYKKAHRAANKEKMAELDKAYYEANKEEIAESRKAYREANKERCLEYSSRRRARKRKAIPKFLRNCEVERKRLQDTYKLRQLISDATGIEHHVDHMVPLSKGGPHWSGNLQILTATENLSKRAKLCKTLKKNIKASLEIARKEYDNDEDHSNRHRD